MRFLYFLMNDAEIDIMVAQNVIPSRQSVEGSKPFAFTAQQPD